MKIWITVSTFNRKKITEIVLKQLVEFKKDSFIHVSDDYSNEYSVEWLKSLNVDKVEQPPEKYGIDKIRAWELKKFLETDFDLIYFTDNDAYHDPQYIEVLKDAYNRFKKPISLYNSIYHTEHNEKLDENFVLRKTIPGISQLYDRAMVEKIINKIDHNLGWIGMWDYMFIEFLETKVVTSSNSYAQHYGANGINSGPNDYDRDRALSPTKYLIETRDKILRELMI